MAGPLVLGMRALLVVCSVFCTLGAAPSDPAGLAIWQKTMLGGTETFESGLHRWNDDTLAAAQETFESARQQGAPDAILGYWLGTTLFFRTSYAMFGPTHRQNGDSAAEHRAGALEALGMCLEGDEWNGECYAMTGTLYGQQIQQNPLRAFTLGPRVQKMRDKALAADSLNPRVWYLLGINYYHAPVFFGGGAESALPRFLRADSLFAVESEPENVLAPRWGEAVNASFVARAYDRLGNDSAAVAWYRRALVMNPHDRIARRRLEGLETAR